ncbi:uncharacterized protein LOC117315167 [Pecten maximus]|uniref:uncharacterized protein LOC117315167 n=1 Tax=Pecten maximus TaxID=6579 RepID=UPI0014581388|nr:uncharacterized protein LOC117315167 [Pecten maximus]
MVRPDQPEVLTAVDSIQKKQQKTSTKEPTEKQKSVKPPTEKQRNIETQKMQTADYFKKKRSIESSSSPVISMPASDIPSSTLQREQDCLPDCRPSLMTAEKHTTTGTPKRRTLRSPGSTRSTPQLRRSPRMTPKSLLRTSGDSFITCETYEDNLPVLHKAKRTLDWQSTATGSCLIPLEPTFEGCPAYPDFRSTSSAIGQGLDTLYGSYGCSTWGCKDKMQSLEEENRACLDRIAKLEEENRQLRLKTAASESKKLIDDLKAVILRWENRPTDDLQGSLFGSPATTVSSRPVLMSSPITGTTSTPMTPMIVQ